jgi:hypothetical protein
MSNLEPALFVSKWSVLTDRQQKSLLSQLDSFLTVNSKGAGGSRSNPTNSGSSTNVSKSPWPKKKKKKKKQRPQIALHKREQRLQIAVPKRASAFDSTEPSAFPTTGGSHHSPRKVGSDGVALYGKTLYSARAIETLQQKAGLKATAGKEVAAERSAKLR